MYVTADFELGFYSRGGVILSANIQLSMGKNHVGCHERY